MGMKHLDEESSTTTATTISNDSTTTTTTTNINNNINSNEPDIADLKKIYNVNALNLLKRYIQSTSPDSGVDKNDDIRTRFKCIAFLENLEEVGLGGPSAKLVNTFNGKPFIIAKTARWFRGPGYFELDVDVHCFAMAARLALYNLSEQAYSAKINFGCVVQGNTDDELPEQIIGAMYVSALQLENSQPFPF